MGSIEKLFFGFSCRKLKNRVTLICLPLRNFIKNQA